MAFYAGKATEARKKPAENRRFVCLFFGSVHIFFLFFGGEHYSPNE
jgi:hypothetical protein